VVVSWFDEALESLPSGSDEAAATVSDRAQQVLRPTGALARLDDLAVHLARWQHTASPAVAAPAALIFAGDHGVAFDAAVSAYPVEVTAAMLEAFRAGRSTINAFSRVAGATVQAIDVGVARPTADIRHAPALTPERFAEAAAAGQRAVHDVDADVLVIGEMGIGNTTVAAAVAAALFRDVEPAAWVGRGTGVDDDGLARKVAAVTQAVERIAHVTDPVEVLRQVGGSELVAMAAAIVTARHRRLPVVLDGFVVTAAAAVLSAVRSDALDHCVVAHCSAEPGHRRLLEQVGHEPLLDLGLRLGEGSAAMAVIPLLAMACAGVTQVPTFGEWFG
jgi:nicotinate-nucleotide--dimethylbenzimidazole phosphoribosyltransferase